MSESTKRLDNLQVAIDGIEELFLVVIELYENSEYDVIEETGNYIDVHKLELKVEQYKSRFDKLVKIVRGDR